LISLTNPSFLIVGEIHSVLPSIDLITLQIAQCTQSCLLIPKLTETIAFWLASFPVRYQGKKSTGSSFTLLQNKEPRFELWVIYPQRELAWL
jgi:hypothetical protein